MDTCGLKCLKWLMFVFNFLFFVGGCALLGLGIWVVADGASFANIFGMNITFLFDAAYIFIAVGVALIVISFFGFCGAVKENKCMLGTFFAIVLIIFIVEIVGAILAFVLYPQAVAAILTNMSRYQTKPPTTATHAIKGAWDAIQSVAGCCGFNSSTNWQQYGPFPYTFNGTTYHLPESCCVPSNSAQENLNCIAGTSDFYSSGCEAKVESYYLVIGGVGIAVLVIEILAMIFACCLFKSAGKDNNYA